MLNSINSLPVSCFHAYPASFTCFVLPDQNRHSFKPCVCLDLVFLTLVPREAHFVFFVLLLLLFGTVPHLSNQDEAYPVGKLGHCQREKPSAAQRPGLQPVYECLTMADHRNSTDFCLQQFPLSRILYTFGDTM